LLNEYSNNSAGYASGSIEVPPTISEEPRTPNSEPDSSKLGNGTGTLAKKLKRTPRELYKVTDETSPLLEPDEDDDFDGPKPEIPGMEDDSVESGDRIVKIAIYINLVANAILLMGKIAVIVLSSSLSVLASLVDAALDFLSTAIVWTTTKLIESSDSYQYPVGRRRLEPLGVLVFSVIMITSFFQVALVRNSPTPSALHITSFALKNMSSEPTSAIFDCLSSQELKKRANTRIRNVSPVSVLETTQSFS
jgi:hypothetical protein